VNRGRTVRDIGDAKSSKFGGLILLNHESDRGAQADSTAVDQIGALFGTLNLLIGIFPEPCFSPPNAQNRVAE
jgi:hypothetical protein